MVFYVNAKSKGSRSFFSNPPSAGPPPRGGRLVTTIFFRTRFALWASSIKDQRTSLIIDRPRFEAAKKALPEQQCAGDRGNAPGHILQRPCRQL